MAGARIKLRRRRLKLVACLDAAFLWTAITICGRLVQEYAACSLWQLVSVAARLPRWREEAGPYAAVRLHLAIRLLRFFR